jgi:hypothetical protein
MNRANAPVVELVALEVSNRLREQAGTEEEQDVGRNDEEDGQVDARSGRVDQVCGQRKWSVGRRSTAKTGSSQPTIKPARSPTMAARGIDLADCPSETWKRARSQP